MAVKVMWARVTRDEKTSAPAACDGAERLHAAPVLRATAEREKPKRRRSAVYDADGNEVFITLVCLKCHKARPLAQFGLRKMADGAIRNQPWCKACRAGSSAKPAQRIAEGAVPGESPVVEESLSPAAAVPQDNLAAQIAAALHAGRR